MSAATEEGAARGGSGRPDTPRSLADDLRSRSDDELVALLRGRVDLAVPVPTDLTSLAVRATTRASVQRALDRLDAPHLEVVEALAVLTGGVTAAAVGRAWGADARSLVAHLREIGLVWGTPRALRLVRAAAEAVGPYPAGLGPAAADPGVAARLRAGVEPLLADAPEGSLEVLRRLAWGPPVGEFSGARPGSPVHGEGPVPWLVRAGLLDVAEAGLVVLPREVGLALRDGRTHRTPSREAPEVTGREVGPPERDGAAAHQAAEVVRLVAQLLELLGRAPASVLRAGGLGVRDLRRVAGALEVDEATAAQVVELAHAAGLVDSDGEESPSWLPTLAADLWMGEDVAERWLALVRAWLTATSVPSLVGTQDPSGGTRAALSESVRRPGAPRLREELLGELLGLPPTLAADVDSLLARLAHRGPRRAGPGRDELVRRFLDEATWLGVTGAGALSAAGRALVADPLDELAATRLAESLPAPVDHLLLQADLTAVAPGPLVRELEVEVDLAAEVESRGGATVYRFSAGSVRRALDAGRTADELLALLDRASPTGVPQPLEYLIRDVARRHGLLRVGHAGSYVRAEDPAALAELLVDRRLAQVGLRRLAPTVLASTADGPTLLAALRRVGLAPAAEAADGSLVLRGHEPRRATRRRVPGGGRPAVAPDEADLAEAVRRWRLADSAPTPGSVELPHLEPRVSLEVLRDAVTSGRQVWIGYVDETGRTTRRLLHPRTLSGGRLTAVEVGRPGTRTFSVHRVTGAAVAGEVEH